MERSGGSLDMSSFHGNSSSNLSTGMGTAACAQELFSSSVSLQRYLHCASCSLGSSLTVWWKTDNPCLVT